MICSDPIKNASITKKYLLANENVNLVFDAGIIDQAQYKFNQCSNDKVFAFCDVMTGQIQQIP